MECRGNLPHLRKDVFKAEMFNLRTYLTFETFDESEDYKALRRTPTPTLPQSREGRNIKTSQSKRNRIQSLRDPRAKAKKLNKSSIEFDPSPKSPQKILITEENGNFFFTSPIDGFISEAQLAEMSQYSVKKHKMPEPTYNRALEEQMFGNFKSVQTRGMEYRDDDEEGKTRPSSLQMYRHAIFQPLNARKRKVLSDLELKMLALSRDKTSEKDRLSRELLLFSTNNSKNFKIKAKVDLGIKFKI